MKQIKAAGDLVITLDDQHWQLSNRRQDALPLVKASVEMPVLTYHPAFSEARKLPPEGELSTSHIAEVIVGWARSDRAWHLGFLLNDVLAAQRGGRWCELAHWPDEQAALEADNAQLAGQALAAVIGRRFRFVAAPPAAPVWPVSTSEPTPPRGIPQVPAQQAGAVPALNIALRHEAEQIAGADWMKPAAAQWQMQYPYTASSDMMAVEQPVPGTLPSSVVRVRRKVQPLDVLLPLELGGWTLRPISVGLQWARTGGWSLGTAGRILFNILLGGIFIGLALLAINSAYAPVEPAFLPYLAIVVGGIQFYMALRLVRRMVKTQATAIDTERREVRCHLDLTSDVVNVYPFDEIRAVVVSQYAQQERRGRNGKPGTMVHEAWLHLLLNAPRQALGKQRRTQPSDAYVTLGYLDSVEGEIVAAHFEGKARQRQLVLLYPDEATTPAQQAALVIARAIGVDAYVDQR